MTRRAATIGVLATALVVAVALAIVLSDGGNEPNESKPTGPARATALATAPNGDAYALVERIDNGLRHSAVGPIGDDGEIDPTTIDLPIDDVTAIAVERDDALLVAGTRLVDGTRRLAIGRLGLDGQPDRSFGTDGVLTIKAGGGDAIPRGIATSRDGKTAAVVADSTRGTRHAMALVRVDLKTARTTVGLADDTAAGGVVARAGGGYLAAGTDTRNGDLVLTTGGPTTTRLPAQLRSATWRAVAPTPDGGAVVVGSGRTPDLRSLVAYVRVTPALAEADRGTVAVGDGDGYGAAVATDRNGRILIAANGSQDDAPAAYLVTLPGDGKAQRKAPGRAAGVTTSGGILTTRWDGQRQSVAFNP